MPNRLGRMTAGMTYVARRTGASPEIAMITAIYESNKAASVGRPTDGPSGGEYFVLTAL
ncbi:hypothetical protein SAMN05519103_09520 [Rhizobiales bacterium GAS113]|nr:hypothetical protein SAMN05519103_09520 [Rhizobiales bacterium GAS113]